MGGGIEGLLCIDDDVSLASMNMSTSETSSNVGWTCPSSEPRLVWQVIEGGESIFESGVSKFDATQSLCSVERAICDSGVPKCSFRVFSNWRKEGGEDEHRRFGRDGVEEQ